MKNGWSIKQLHRMIVLSATYQQQSLDHANGKKIDPENVLLWKSNRRRLDFESMRDALLRVSGRFDPTLGGPSTRDILGGNANRRTMYGYLDRLNVPGLYRTFDFPHPDATSPQRDETTVAPQALFLMNNVFVRDCATVMLRRPEVLNAKEPSAKVDVLYQLCYGRSPTMREREIALAYLSAPNEPGRSWEAFAQALMLTNEFVYVD